MVRVKICGITNLEDALISAEAGADALGFVFYEKSPRHVSPELARAIISKLPPFVQTVGLFVNESQDRINRLADFCRLELVQLHGDETPDFCRGISRRTIKALRVKDRESLDRMADYPVSGMLLDAWSDNSYGGTGKCFDWEIAAMAARSTDIILAGGLTPENVAEAVHRIRPYAVDVSSSLELQPGKKDAEKIRCFARNAKSVVFETTG